MKNLSPLLRYAPGANACLRGSRRYDLSTRPLRTLGVSVVIAVLLSPWIAFAQTYPSKPVRLLIPWPPGGSNDVVGRIVFQKVSESVGQPFPIDNRGGAAGTIGAALVAKSVPDGYTVMVHTSTHVGNAHLYKKLPYDTLKDFIGVTPLVKQVGVLVVHPSLPVKSVKEFIALARARPGEVVYASTGSGGTAHLAMALFNSMTATRMVHVPYKGGGPAGIALVALIASYPVNERRTMWRTTIMNEGWQRQARTA